jgi:hypothetical protein
MKSAFSNLIVVFVIVFTSCKKEKVVTMPPTQPQPVVEMEYTNLNNAEIKYGHPEVSIDLNKDNRADLMFEVMRVGDFINKLDKFNFNILTSITTSVPVNGNEQIPVMLKNALIPLNDFGGNNWYGASEITLIQKVLFENMTVNWRGNWLTVQRGYLPVQLFKNSQKYNGWIELTADNANEKLILHRAAVSKEPNKEIKAGL